MNKELQNQLDDFINDFLSVPVVKQYLLLKKEILESSDLKELENNLRHSQKEMALSINKPDYLEKKNRYLSLKEQYENDPLIVNYKVCQSEVTYLLDELKNKLS